MTAGPSADRGGWGDAAHADYRILGRPGTVGEVDAE